MSLPPLPLDPMGKEWTDDEVKIIRAYGVLCVKFSRKGPPRKFSTAEIQHIRRLHDDGEGYKSVNKVYPMHLETYYNIIKRRGAYK